MATRTMRNSLPQSVSFIHIYVLLLCSFCFVLTLTQEDSITCSVPSVYPHQDTVLTCHFPEDLSASKKDFTVNHYVHQSKPDAIVDCWWVRGALECFTKPGFTYDKTVNNSLSIKINHVTSENTGSYACQIASYGSNLLKTCELNLETGEDNTCHIKGLDDLWLNLTCYFNEDIEKTKKKFTVYKHDNQEKWSVIRCWWEDGQPTCQGDVSYLYDKKVSSYLEMAIKRDQHERTSVYSCWHEGSVSDRVKTCSFVANNSATEEKPSSSSAIGITLGVLIPALLVLVIVGVIIFKRWRKLFKTAEDNQNDPESQGMLQKKWDKVTEDFQEFLLNNVRQAFPNMLNTYYFVPPNYYNKTQYITESIADEVIYIYEPPDPSKVRHDQAMQHVLHCLRHMAEDYRKQMFVLTQFRYEDYLNSPEPAFRNHRLPIPAGLKEKKEKDRTIGCFDILIIHRVHGVVVAVVKCVSENDNDCRENKRRSELVNQGEELETQNRVNPDREKKIDILVVKEISDAIQQLSKADRMIRHLMSDLDRSLSIQPTLILPNVTSCTLQRVFSNHPELTKKLSATDNPTSRCLCSDHLSSPTAPWDVDSTVISNLKTWLNSSLTNGHTMSDENYENIISRFCGPATTSYIEAANKSEQYRLPKTMSQAVSITGDLFERLTLYPGMRDLLKEPLVFIIGEPGTGKTKMLSLVGRTWISQGHKVCVVNTWPEGSAAAKQLEKLLQKTSGTSSSQSPVQANVVPVYCNIDNDRSIDKSINDLAAHAEKNRLYVLVDELPREIEQPEQEQVIRFLRRLKERVEGLHMWVASYSSDISPPGWRGRFLTEPISCPPSVVRETEQCSSGINEYSTSKYILPSDGLPVKTIRHEGQGHVKREPRDCEVCGEQIAKVLTEDLRVGDTDTVIDIVDTPSPQRMQGPPSTLPYRDVLILFEGEGDVTESTPMVTCLKDKGIPVQVISSRDQENMLQEDRDSVLVAKAGFLYGLKRKVVVYVEGDRHQDTQENRLRGITSCTSQLVLVRMPEI